MELETALSNYRWRKDRVELDVKDIIGGTINRVIGLTKDTDAIRFDIELETQYVSLVLWHQQDCCEHVTLEDYESDVEDWSGAKILSFEEVSEAAESGYESATYTFYKIETDRGGLWLRWLGKSNGYYSERVDVSIVPMSVLDEVDP